MSKRPTASPDAATNPTSPNWAFIAAAVFGAITFLLFAGYTFLASTNPSFICNSFELLAVLFALGCGLSAAFLGGATTFNIGMVKSAIGIGAGGGIAVVFATFFLFHQYPPRACEKQSSPAPSLSPHHLSLISIRFATLFDSSAGRSINITKTLGDICNNKEECRFGCSDEFFGVPKVNSETRSCTITYTCSKDARLLTFSQTNFLSTEKTISCEFP